MFPSGAEEIFPTNLLQYTSDQLKEVWRTRDVTVCQLLDETQGRSFWIFQIFINRPLLKINIDNPSKN